MPPERIRKPRDAPAPYARKPGPKGKRARDGCLTSAKNTTKKTRNNLTLQDWLIRITLGFACNADGSEKMPVLFIGKSKRPRCFKAMSPAQHGFYYRHNKKAWMTKEIFEECVRLFFMFQYL